MRNKAIDHNRTDDKAGTVSKRALRAVLLLLLLLLLPAADPPPRRRRRRMDTLREEAFVVQAIKVQKVARGLVAKMRMRAWMKTIAAVKGAMGARSEPDLVAAMDLMNELPHGENGKRMA
jgi:hypothetical protein